MRGERVLAERRWALETTFSQELLAAIDAVLREAAVARGEIAAIAVDAGPGGYSGLRTGVATAQGLALALDVPLAGLSRLEADAFPTWTANARSSPCTTSAASAPRGPPTPPATTTRAPLTLVEPRIDGFEGCAREAPVGALWCGELSDELRAALDAAGRRGDGRGAAAGEPPQRRRPDAAGAGCTTPTPTPRGWTSSTCDPRPSPPPAPRGR